MDESKFIDGKIHSRISGEKGLRVQIQLQMKKDHYGWVDYILTISGRNICTRNNGARATEIKQFELLQHQSRQQQTTVSNIIFIFQKKKNI